MEPNNGHWRGFVPYGLAAFLIGMVGGWNINEDSFRTLWLRF